MLKIIKEKIANGQRINDAEALYLFKTPLPTLGELATQVKKRFHPEAVTTFVIDININLTNVCECECKFCAFYVRSGDKRTFTLTADEVLEKTRTIDKTGRHPGITTGRTQSATKIRLLYSTVEDN